MKGDTIKVLNDMCDLGCVLLLFSLLAGNLIAAAGRKQRRRLQRAPEAIERCRCAFHVQFYVVCAVSRCARHC